MLAMSNSKLYKKFLAVRKTLKLRIEENIVNLGFHIAVIHDLVSAAIIMP